MKTKILKLIDVKSTRGNWTSNISNRARCQFHLIGTAQSPLSLLIVLLFESNENERMKTRIKTLIESNCRRERVNCALLTKSSPVTVRLGGTLFNFLSGREETLVAAINQPRTRPEELLTSRRKDWGRPPLKPSEHLTENEVMEILDREQLCT